MVTQSIRNIGAIGAGAMGSYTALCFAVAGYTVQLYDLTDDAVQKGMQNIRTGLDDYQKHGLIKQSEIASVISRIEATTDLSETGKNADFIIESVLENIEIKQNVFSKLDDLCPPHTIFATNTSGLSPTKIAESITRKDKFIVTHFWNPPHLLPLVEVVPGEKTSSETIDIACDLMTKIGKKPVRLNRESLGFVGNRLQLALLREALHIVETGLASAEDVDTVMEYSLGRRLSVTGPLKSADLGGLDVFKNIFSYLGSDLCNATDIPALLQQTVDAAHYGAKTGKGFYDWTPDTLNAIKEQRVAELFRHLQNDKNTASDHRITRKAS